MEILQENETDRKDEKDQVCAHSSIASIMLRQMHEMQPDRNQWQSQRRNFSKRRI